MKKPIKGLLNDIKYLIEFQFSSTKIELKKHSDLSNKRSKP